MAQQHDRDQRRELPPDLDLEQPEGSCPARDKRDDDRERDQGHHARPSVAQLALSPSNEHEAAVEKDDRPARTQPEPEEAVMDVVPIGGEQPRAPNQAPQQGHHDVEDRQRKRQQRRGDRDGRGGLHGSRDREGRQGEADEE